MATLGLALTMSPACTNDVALTRGDGGSDAPVVPDGGVGADAEITRPVDASDTTDAANAAVCGETIPCCPDDLNTTGLQDVVTIRYPTTIVRNIDGEVPASTDGVSHSATFNGTLAGVTTLATSATEQCVARFATSPPSLPCAADAVVQIDRVGETPTRFVVGLPSSELSAFATGTNVRVRVDQGIGDQSYPEDHLILSVERTDGAVLFVAASLSLPSDRGGPTATWNFGQFAVTRSSTPFCVAAPMSPCMRVFEADDLVVTIDGVSHTIHPTETETFTTILGRYRVTHRAITRRNSALEGVSCTDIRPDHWSFEIVRIGD
jgi:hypothetical protein